MASPVLAVHSGAQSRRARATGRPRRVERVELVVVGADVHDAVRDRRRRLARSPPVRAAPHGVCTPAPSHRARGRRSGSRPRRTRTGRRSRRRRRRSRRRARRRVGSADLVRPTSVRRVSAQPLNVASNAYRMWSFEPRVDEAVGDRRRRLHDVEGQSERLGSRGSRRCSRRSCVASRLRRCGRPRRGTRSTTCRTRRACRRPNRRTRCRRRRPATSRRSSRSSPSTAACRSSGCPSTSAFPRRRTPRKVPPDEPTYTTPCATAGDDSTSLPIGAVHIGRHVFGVPEQFVVPVASNAYNLSSPEPTYTCRWRPPATRTRCRPSSRSRAAGRSSACPSSWWFPPRRSRTAGRRSSRRRRRRRSPPATRTRSCRGRRSTAAGRSSACPSSSVVPAASNA